jgi:hypothetical protein
MINAGLGVANSLELKVFIAGLKLGENKLFKSNEEKFFLLEYNTIKTI